MKGVLVRYSHHDLLYKHYKHLLYSAIIAVALAFISTLWLLHSFQTVPVRVFCTEPCLPQDFPASGNGLWFTSPATWWSTQYLPIGNGHLGAMVSGGTSFEIVQINIESLWSGGPFQDPLYNGGNPPADARTSLAEDMQSIRDTIFSSGTIDNIDVLQEPAGAYGSYAGAGFLTTTVDVSGNISGYARWLDLDDGIAKATWTQDDQIFNRETYCSEPAQACVQHFYSDFDLPDTTVAFDTSIETGFITPNVTCLDNVPGAIQVRNIAPGATGMLYEILISVEAHPSSAVITCVPRPGGSANATITVSGATDAWITWVGDTDFLQTAANFTFQGPDPHLSLVSTLTQVSDSGQPDPAEHQADLKAQYLQDYHAHVTPLSLSLGPTVDRDEIQPIDVAKAAYLTDIGNPWLEWVLFNYGRYMLVTSARGTLPSNLQGVWADGATNAWSADYHANINTQMNYWAAEMLNLPLNITQSLWDYLEFNWAPRGTYTAQVLYNISQGWVTHNEMNIFGHTGMKLSGNSAQWSDYPESAVWMMIHVWDHFDFSGDVEWWQRQGYPLVKGVASFHLQKLIEDRYFNDSTLVTAPCNSPEQVPITFGCAHAQQVIWQLLNAVEKGFNASGDNDLEFLQTVRDERARMDYGVRIGSWGQLQEWKIDMDSPTDTHRHLSHLIGLYPGYALTHYNPSFQPVKNLSQPERYLNYTNADVVEASEISLIHRGNGTGPDADAGWEKVWRAAAWAQLGNASEFYHELTYTIERDFAGNLFSVYNPLDPDPLNIFFQIDANLGYPAAVLNALIQAPDVPALDVPLVITLLPALPSQWASQGHLTGVRVRGGITVDLYWKDGQPTSVLFTVDNDDGTRTVADREVVVVYNSVIVADFVTSPGLKRAVTKFGQTVRFRGQRADY